MITDFGENRRKLAPFCALTFNKGSLHAHVTLPMATLRLIKFDELWFSNPLVLRWVGTRWALPCISSWISVLWSRRELHIIVRNVIITRGSVMQRDRATTTSQEIMCTKLHLMAFSRWMTLNLKVTQGHRNCRSSISYISLPISGLQ